MENFKVLGYNNLNLFCTKYDVPNPKAVVIIIHGMQEHSGRYIDFAQFLNAQNYTIITSDSRGHGKTMVDKTMYGHGEKDIFTESIQDQLKIIEYVKINYPSLPIYLFGHSYGSFLSQRLIQVSPAISKVVLCGTTYGNNFSYKAGLSLASILTLFGKENSKASTIEKMSLSTWGAKFKNGNWLSRDDKVFEEYQQDPLCGGSFPISFYKSLFKNMIKINNGIKLIGPNKKILLIVGECDPVGNNSKLVKKLYKTYIKNGINAQLIAYPNARHELLNEINKHQVYNDILDFLK